MARSSRSRDLIFGVLFFGTLIGLGWVTTQLRTFPGMGNPTHLNVLFEDVNGVRKEDSVLVYGTRYGRVSQVLPIKREAWQATGRTLTGPTGKAFTPNVLLVIELEYPVTLRQGYRIHAEDQNLLGGKVVTIAPGEPSATPIADVGPTDTDLLDPSVATDLKKVVLIGDMKPSPLMALGKLVEDNLDKVNQIVDNVVEGSKGLDDKNGKGMLGYLLTNPDARKSAMNVMQRLNDLADQTGKADNIIHDLFHPSPLKDNLDAGVKNLREFTDDARKPGALLNELVSADSQLKKDIDSAASNISKITEDARRPGTMISELTDNGPDALGGKIKSTIDDVKGTFASARQLIEDGKRNQGSVIYALAYGDLGTVARNALSKIESTVDKVDKNIVDPIGSSKGALGYIINDPESRVKLDRLLSTTLGIIEDAREAAPITSLGSFIFGGF